MDTIRPLSYQKPLPMETLIKAESPSAEAIEMDVLFVGGGPSGLSGAIHLAQLMRKDKEAGGSLGEISIGVLEKGGSLGSHNLSGAVVNPIVFREMFPDMDESEFPFREKINSERVYHLSAAKAKRIPVPPTMKNEGFYASSICEIVRWLGDKAEALGIDVFPGFPVDSLLVEKDRVLGVRTTPQGLNSDGSPSSQFVEAGDLTAKVTVLSEGTRGALTQGYLQWQGIDSTNPQIYALGVKEVWEVTKPLDHVIHTMGYPLVKSDFGGSWIYPYGKNQVSIGLVVGLDYGKTNVDVHQMLQKLKQHPLFRDILDGGKLIEWGAKTIPEGGYYSLPQRRSGDGLLITGDAAGFVNVPALKGIHYAMKSGVLAAEQIFEALKAGDTSAAGLAGYDQKVNESFIGDDLYRTRNIRLAFKSGFYFGGLKAMLMTVTKGLFPGWRITVKEDADEEKQVEAAESFVPDGSLTFSKVDSVFKAGNQTRDDIPSHLDSTEDVPEEIARMYESLCPAGVYEVSDGKLVMNAPNCVDCKATDILGPRWMPREGGSGPSYRTM